MDIHRKAEIVLARAGRQRHLQRQLFGTTAAVALRLAVTDDGFQTRLLVRIGTVGRIGKERDALALCGRTHGFKCFGRFIVQVFSAFGKLLQLRLIALRDLAGVVHNGKQPVFLRDLHQDPSGRRDLQCMRVQSPCSGGRACNQPVAFPADGFYLEVITRFRLQVADVVAAARSFGKALVGAGLFRRVIEQIARGVFHAVPRESGDRCADV